jgi:hypothetical protein
MSKCRRTCVVTEEADAVPIAAKRHDRLFFNDLPKRRDSPVELAARLDGNSCRVDSLDPVETARYDPPPRA